MYLKHIFTTLLLCLCFTAAWAQGEENQKVATPEFHQDGKFMSITCETPGAKIHYKIGGGGPSQETDLYKGTFEFEYSPNPIMVKAIAYADGMQPSEVSEYETPQGSTVCAQVKISLNGDILTLTCPTEGAKIVYAMDRDAIRDDYSNEYTGPVRIPINCVLKAKAMMDNRWSSEPESLNIDWFKVATPRFKQTGNILDIICDTPNADVFYTVGGGEPTTDSEKYEEAAPVILTDRRVVTVKAFAHNLNPSDVVTYTPDTPTPVPCDKPVMSFDGKHITMETTTKMASIFYTIDGSTPDERSIPYEKAFDPGKMVTIKAVAVRNPMKNSEVVTLELPYYSNGTVVWVNQQADTDKAFSIEGTDKVAAVVWNVSSNFPETIINKINNPNLLFYTKSKAYVPASVKNVIENGTAENITLTAASHGGNCGYYCPQAFKAKNISYTRTFTKNTYIGESAGWETITLPFDVGTVMHKNGECATIAVAKAATKGELNPYWLYTLKNGEDRFVADERIRAYVPYIICMPNNEEYGDRYILAGDVTFSAQNIDVPATDIIVVDGRNFHMHPVMTAVPQGPTVFAINNEEYDGKRPGAVFAANLHSIAPFEAYLTTSTASRALVIDECGAEQSAGITTHYYKADNGETVIYNINGVRVASAKEPAAALQSLPQGLYIINGKVVRK